MNYEDKNPLKYEVAPFFMDEYPMNISDSDKDNVDGDGMNPPVT